MKKLQILIVYMLVGFLLVGCQTENTKEFTRGEWDGYTYYNDFASIQMQIPSTWVIGTDEDIANIMGLSAEYLSTASDGVSKELLESAFELQIVMDTIVMDYDTGNNINISFENLALAIGGKNLTVEQYLELTKQNIINWNLGYNSVEQGEDRYIGEYTYLTLELEMADASMQYQLLRREGDYMICITLTISADAKDTDVDSFLRYFS